MAKKTVKKKSKSKSKSKVQPETKKAQQALKQSGVSVKKNK